MAVEMARVKGELQTLSGFNSILSHCSGEVFGGGCRSKRSSQPSIVTDSCDTTLLPELTGTAPNIVLSSASSKWALAACNLRRSASACQRPASESPWSLSPNIPTSDLLAWALFHLLSAWRMKNTHWLVGKSPAIRSSSSSRVNTSSSDPLPSCSESGTDLNSGTSYQSVSTSSSTTSLLRPFDPPAVEVGEKLSFSARLVAMHREDEEEEEQWDSHPSFSSRTSSIAGRR
mmetsp:Transcript_84952/g.177545  ORF Transcript_84952/g.177545 Transcript_84952/m.177545 type:complete len:231 (+) Transcript_84952:750-1442(+)